MLIFVCTGNICRSAMAEVMAKEQFAKHAISLPVCSRGVATEHGWQSTQEAKSVVRKYGLSLEAHRSAPINQQDIDQATLILTMTQTHKQMILQRFNHAQTKTVTIYEYVHGTDKDVNDPYACGLAVYKQCAEEIYALVQATAQKLLSAEGGK